MAQNSSLVTFKTKHTATNKNNFDRHKYRKVSKLTFPTKEEQNLFFIKLEVVEESESVVCVLVAPVK